MFSAFRWSQPRGWLCPSQSDEGDRWVDYVLRVPMKPAEGLIVSLAIRWRQPRCRLCSSHSDEVNWWVDYLLRNSMKLAEGLVSLYLNRVEWADKKSSYAIFLKDKKKDECLSQEALRLKCSRNYKAKNLIKAIIIENTQFRNRFTGKS